jgi:hypothetical protein
MHLEEAGITVLLSLACWVKLKAAPTPAGENKPFTNCAQSPNEMERRGAFFRRANPWPTTRESSSHKAPEAKLPLVSHALPRKIAAPWSAALSRSETHVEAIRFVCGRRPSLGCALGTKTGYPSPRLPHRCLAIPQPSTSQNTRVCFVL